MVGRPTVELVDGIEVAVDEGYIMDCDMPYGWEKAGGSMPPLFGYPPGPLGAIEPLAGACGVLGVCGWLLGYAWDSEPNWG
jgi:hypothetical protein